MIFFEKLRIILILIFKFWIILSNMEFGSGKIGGKYALGPKIGSGSFGQVYLVNNFGTQQIYALKKQDQKSKHLQLLNQSKILRHLQGSIGFPKVYWNGSEYKSNMMVIDLLGPSIQNLFFICNKKFSLKTTLMLADQFIQRIQILHTKDYIHRDIKPENFLMGLSKKTHIVHLIDFGLSKKYRDNKTHQHIPYKENKNLTGTARYASINAHLGIQQSRRDDLQSIGYVLIYLLQGHLPWQGVRANNKIQKYQKIMQKKMSIPIEIQCRSLPIEFSIYLNYCRNLKFQDKPNYNYLRNLFLDLLQKNLFTYDFQYDWCKLNEQKQIQHNNIRIQIRKPISINEMQQQIIEEEQELLEITVKEEKKKRNLSRKDQILQDGQENIIDDVDHSEEDFVTKKTKDKNINDLQQKKNKLLYEQ